MKLTDITQYCKKNFPDSYERLSRRLDQTEDPEMKVRFYVAASTLICFSIGMFYDLIVYAFSAMFLPLTANILTLSVYVAAALLYLHGKLAVTATLTILLIAVQANISVSICYNYFTVIDSNKFTVSCDLFLSFLACILAALTFGKKQVYILCMMPVSTLAAVLAIHSPHILVLNFPSFCLAYIAPPVLLIHIRMLLWDTIRKKEQLLSEKKSLCRLMGMNEEQWDLLIDVVQKPHAPRKQTEQLFNQMQDTIDSQLVIRAKRLLASEELLGQINEKHGFALTANDMRLCCLILEDKTIAEISHILYINESSVRASRSRVRKKMKLDKETNLKAYLLMLVGGDKDKSETNFQEQRDDLLKY